MRTARLVGLSPDGKSLIVATETVRNWRSRPTTVYGPRFGATVPGSDNWRSR